MPVRCVAFDADDTLWDFTGAMRRGLALALEVLAEVHPAVAAALDLPALEAAWDDAYAAYVADPRPNDRVDDLRPRSFATVLAAHGVVDADLVREVLDAQEVVHGHHLDARVGLRRSRSESPSMLPARTVAMSTPPGSSAIHHPCSR